MCFYFFLFAHLLKNVSNSSSSKWDFEKGGQDWPESCKTAEQAPIDISKPFDYKSKNLFLIF